MEDDWAPVATAAAAAGSGDWEPAENPGVKMNKLRSRAPRWDVLGDVGRAAKASGSALVEDAGAAFPSFDTARQQQQANREQYGRVGGMGMDLVDDVKRLGSAAKIPLDALGVVTAPLTGLINSTAGSALSYVWPHKPDEDPKVLADEAIGTAMMGMRPGAKGRTFREQADSIRATREAELAARQERAEAKLTNKAVAKVGERIEQDAEAGGLTAQEALDALGEARDAGKPLTLADLGGENVRGLAGNVARKPGPARNLVKQFMDERDAGAGERLAADVADSIATGSMRKTSQALLDARSSAGRPAYEAVHGLEGIWSDRLAQLTTDPDIRKGLSWGARLERREAAAEGRKFDPTQMGIDLDAEGNVAIKSVPNMRVLDMGKRGLDAMIAAERDPITSRLSADGVSLEKLRSAYVKEIDRLDTGGVYKAARDAWAGPSASLDAIRRGRTILARSPEEIAEEFGKLTAADKEFYRLGAADLIREKIEKTGIGGDEAKAIIRNERNRKQLRPLFDGDEAFDKFVNSVTAERKMFEARQDILGNSKTQARAMEDATVDLDPAFHIAHGGAKLASGNVLGAIHSAWRGGRDFAGRLNPKLNLEIARILTDPNLGAGQGARMLQSVPLPKTQSLLQRGAINALRALPYLQPPGQ